MARKRILIVVHPGRPEAAAVVASLRPWLDERAEVVNVIGTPPDDQPLKVQADLCIVFGGDGTLLATARQLAPLGIPMMGVNMGKLGFLADFNVEHLQRHLDDILAARVRPVERIMLLATADASGGRFSSLVANDMAIVSGAPFRVIDLRVSCGADEIATYLGDGLVVATPTGTTAYNLSAGGPILEPALDAMVITPIAPHSLSLRPIVVGGGACIQIAARRVNPGTTLVIDGQLAHPLGAGQTVQIRRADHNARIIPHPGRTFFDKLTEKLHWGRSPHHS